MHHSIFLTPFRLREVLFHPPLSGSPGMSDLQTGTSTLGPLGQLEVNPMHQYRLHSHNATLKSTRRQNASGLRAASKCTSIGQSTLVQICCYNPNTTSVNLWLWQELRAFNRSTPVQSLFAIHNPPRTETPQVIPEQGHTTGTKPGTPIRTPDGDRI